MVGGQLLGGLVGDVAKTAGKLVGVNSTQALALTETIGQATQLTGVLRGEELNSVLEQAPRLAKALADGLGVTTAELRKLGGSGQPHIDASHQHTAGTGRHAAR